MSTCPRCGGYLGQNHRCFGGRRILRSVVLGLAGAVAGFVLTWGLVDRPADLLLLIMALLGSILTLAARRYARF